MPNAMTPPLFMDAVSGTDIVAFNLQNYGDEAAQAGYTSFGQVFAMGAVKPEQSLTATIDGVSYPVQVDAKSFFSDGSIQMAVLTVSHGTINADTTAAGMLSESAESPAVRTVDVLSALKNSSATSNIHFSDGSEFDVDLFAEARAAVANGTANLWLSGPNVTQINFSTPVQGSLRLVTTISAFADGSYSTSISFNNDAAMGSAGGALSYSVDVFQNGKQVSSIGSLTEYQYQDWQTSFSNSSVSAINVQHDPAYLEAVKAIPNYDLVTGVASSVISAEQQDLTEPGFGAPLSNNFVTQYMPTTGGRGDIGPTTQGNAAWLVSQDPTAAVFALSQADASGAVPWNMWDTSRSEYLNSDAAVDIWTDGRGGPGSYTTGLTQQVDTQDSGWVPDTSHQPDLSYYAFIMTGSNSDLQHLNAQASWDITNTWAYQRGVQQLVVNQQQVRAAAWNLRDIDEASYANPDGTSAKAYFSGIADSNWKWLVSQIPAWTELQGAAFGQVEGTYAPGKMAPWQQDYFASTAIQAAQHGNADALTFLTWESNFLVGRFLQTDFSPRDGIAYNLIVASSDGTRLQTWSAIEAATVSSGNSNGTGWEQSEGDYGEAALSTLSGIISLTGSSSAIKAYNYLVTSQAPATDVDSRTQDVQFDTIPNLPDGMVFAVDGTIVPAGQTHTIVSPPANVSAPTSLQALLVLEVSEDAYQGDAQFTVFVDGQQVGGVFTASASHSAGQTLSVSLPGSLDGGTHAVAVNFLNDSYGGPGLDRNLYVDGASLNGTPVAGASASMFQNGSFTFAVGSQSDGSTPAVVPSETTANAANQPAAPELTLQVSEDAYQGDAQFTVFVDGQQVGGVFTASASHSAGQTQSVSLPGSLDGGTHAVAVNFLNDSYGGPGLDRNLYVDGASLNGTPVAGASASMFQNGSFTFAVGSQSDGSTPAVVPSETTPNAANQPTAPELTLQVSEDAYQGDAQFTVFVDGQQVGGVFTASASHSAGQTQSVSLPGSLDSGTHAVAVNFLNDSYDGPGLDRNLYVDGASLNSTPVAGASASMFQNGSFTFAVGSQSDGSTPAVVPSETTANAANQPTAPELTLQVSEDAYQGDAQFTVFVDGQQVGGVFTASASHSAGQTQSVSLPGSLDGGTHAVAVNFLNDSYGGPGLDRNLYVDGASLNGTPVAGASATLLTNGSDAFAVTVPSSSLLLNISEDAWNGDAQFTVSIDNMQVGGLFSATASHSNGQTQAVLLPTNLSSGDHDVALTFLNDAYGGPGEDRNLYLDSASLNGTPVAGASASMFTTQTSHFEIAVKAG